MEEGDADVGGGEEEEGVEAEDEAVEPCQTMYPHSAPSLDQTLSFGHHCRAFRHNGDLL